LTSGLVLLHLPRGDLIPVESVKALHLDVVLLAVVVAPHPLDVDVVVTFPLARMNAEIETETTIVEIVVETALAARMTGEILTSCILYVMLTALLRDRDVKDERDRDETRENGTNGEDRKGEFEPPARNKN
jgi:hypothetical protein